MESFSAMATILGTRVDATSYAEATGTIMGWAQAREPRKVAAANVHMLIEAWDDPAFRDRLLSYDLVTPDGMPLVWRLRKLVNPAQTRVYGPDLMLEVCAAAERQGVPVGIYGGLPEALQSTLRELRRRFPRLDVVYAHAPPFKPVAVESPETLAAIRGSGARILFVALGCPKQENWIHLNAPELPMVLFAVGAAIDFIGGKVKQAPAWMQRFGMEWLFRLMADPKRLFKRYLYTNSKLIGLWVLGRV